MNRSILLYAILFAVILNTKTASAAPLTLAQNGKSAYVIALPDKADIAEKTAATQLQKYLQQVTGAKLAIKSEGSVPEAAPQFLVGAGRRVKKLARDVNWAALGREGIVIRTVGPRVILAGGKPRGTFYAVYQFLEDTVGCKWWTPTESSIPRKPTLKITDLSTVYMPQFVYREHFTTAYNTDPEFSTIQRQNGLYQTQKIAWGSHYSLLGGGHTFGELVPPAKYFKAHPEWYSDVNNGDLPCTSASKLPEKQGSQLCLSNKAAQRELVKNAFKWIHKWPLVPLISISINDNSHFCRCPDCVKLFKQEGSWSGPLLKFVNEVAAQIGAERPDMLIETLTYVGTDIPPRTIRPAKNVLIRLAPIESDFGHSLNSTWNLKTRDNLLAWSKISSHLFVWNYTTNFRYTSLPHPNWRNLAGDLRFFAANKVTGVFEQGDDYTKGVGDFVQLRTWLIAKLLWNPQRDQSALTNEFLRGYYGPAAPYLGRYLELVQSAYDAQQRPLSTYNEDFSFLDLKTMNAATRLFQQAGAAVKNSPLLATRVRREKLSLDLAWLHQYQWLKSASQREQIEFLGPSDAPAAAQAYIKTAQEFGMQFYGEQKPFAHMAKRLTGMFTPPAPLPEFTRQFLPGDIIDIQEPAFTLYREGEASSIVSDPAASNGKAVRINGAVTDWLTQINTRPYSGFLQNEKWHCYAMVKIEIREEAPPEGWVLQYGIYDVDAKSVSNNGYLVASETQLDQYSMVDLGLCQMSPTKVMWLAAVNNPKVPAVFIDRLILVRQ